ncbi:Uncharacterised protein [Zhongshania aliphaticivorans]|uniref:HTH tetR-type domain-containing protein n=2 Tax=Zhongshania aliphaticivorans TaxID=1470434 RepID=A0A5S9P2M7_9GAMM|nr:Uncharacterised protein [Zhongshania aliphaticivorans]CAA0097296.1 Uncharacterised protein [Zhongshania aliphaticivorans]
MSVGEVGGKRERTRALLLLSSAQQFAKHGYNGVSIDLLAKAAKLSKGALYDHFKSKEDIYIQSTSHYLVSVLKTIKPSDVEKGLNAEQALFLYLGKFLELLHNDWVARRLVLRVITESTGENVQAIARKVLTEPFEYTASLLSAFRPELDAEEHLFSFYCNAILREDFKGVIGALSPNVGALTDSDALLDHFRKVWA